MTFALETPALFGLVFLPFAVVIGIWVAWTDLSRMKIPNAAVLTILGLFLVLGPFLLPLADWGWRWTHFAVVLGVGFLLNQTGLIGAGDVKFAAAAAPYFAVRDAGLLLIPFALLLLAALLAHRAMRRIPAVRKAAPNWASWDSPKFPAGFALGPAFALYLAACAIWGS